jgi:hypothetical protein
MIRATPTRPAASIGPVSCFVCSGAKVASTPDNPISGIISALERASKAKGATDLSAFIARCGIFNMQRRERQTRF